MAENKGSDMFEVSVDSWGNAHPVYPRGHILTPASVHPTRDLAWAERAGVVKRLAEDDPRRNDGASAEPLKVDLSDDGWSHPAFPYAAPLTKLESEQHAAAVKSFEQGDDTSVTTAAQQAAVVADSTAMAAEDARARAEAAEKLSAKAIKDAEKSGAAREPSAGDIATGNVTPAAPAKP